MWIHTEARYCAISAQRKVWKKIRYIPDTVYLQALSWRPSTCIRRIRRRVIRRFQWEASPWALPAPISTDIYRQLQEQERNTIHLIDLLVFIFCNGGFVGAQERRAYLADTLHATHDCSLELDVSWIGKNWEHKLRIEGLYMKRWKEEVCGVACEGSSLKVLGCLIA